jgi:putative aldouronate transport system permease protein
MAFMEAGRRKAGRRGGKIKDSPSERVFSGIIIFILLVLNAAMLYPFLYVLSTSISDQGAVMAGRVWLYPVGFDLTAMRRIANYPLFMSSYINTVFYTAAGTFVCVFMTCLTAYPLSQAKLRVKGFISAVYVVTMFFGGGMIPTFIVYRYLGLFDSRLAMILPGAVSAWNIIICRTFFKSIPESLSESAYLDGASDGRILWAIIVPLSKPIVATLSLFTAVGIWNDFFTGLLYFNSQSKYPLQVVLRMILVSATMTASSGEAGFVDLTRRTASQSLKSASIVLSIVPIMCVYPFIQKHFAKGVMIGSVKE